MKNFSLREVKEEDHQWLVDLHNDPDVLRNLTNPQPITTDHHIKWWDSIKNSSTQLRLIFYVDETRTGFTKFYNIDNINRNCILGADIHKNYRGLGYAKEMWSLMIEHCFKELDLHRISLTTAEYNTIGHKVYKRLGFLEEGRQIQSLRRDEKYYDQICMYFTRDMWQRVVF